MRLQVLEGLNGLVLLLVKVTVPEGAEGLADVSVTFAVQDEAVPTLTGESHEIEVEVLSLGIVVA